MSQNGREETPSILRVLSIHSFRHLWFSQLCSQLGANMLLSILALRIYEITKSNAAVSALYISYGVPAVVFGMLAGVAVDHLDKRKVLAFCNVSRAILMLPLFFAPDTLWVVYLVMFMNAVISQFYLPAEAPLIPKLVPEKYLLTANSVFSFTFFTSIALGFVLAGPSLKLSGHNGSFFILTLLFMTAIWSVSRIPHQKEDVAGLIRILRHNSVYIIKRVFREMNQGLTYAFHSEKVFDSLLLLTGTQIVLAILGALGPGFADRVLHIAVTDASIVILGPAVAGIILGALWVGNYGSKYSTRRLTNTGLLGAGIMLVLISVLVRIEGTLLFGFLLPQSLVIPLAFFLFFLLGLSNSLLDVPANATLQHEAKGDIRGRIYGILAASGGGIGIIPVVSGGILADVIGVGKVLLIVGIVILAYGIVRLRKAFI